MFWKKKADTGVDAETPQENIADETAGREASDTESSDKPGLAARIRLKFAGLIRRFKKPPAFQAEAGQTQNDSAHADTGHSDSAPEDTPPPKTNLKKRLILGGAIGLAVLLLAGVGFAIWKIFLSTPEEDADIPAMVETHRDIRPAPPPPASAAEIEALKKKNAELQAQIEALKKEPQQLQPIEPAAPPASENIRLQSASGEITIDNKDPKATAMSLKEAIDAMNEGSD